MTATVTSFPLSKHTGGGGATPAFSNWLVFLQFTWEVPLPHSPVELSSRQPPLQAFPLQVARAATPAFSGWLVYLQFCEGLPFPPLALRAPRPLCYMSFFVVVVVYSVWFFSFFSLSVGQSVQEAMLIWPRVVWGSTVCHLASLVFCVFQAGRSWCLVAWDPSWFLLLS
jgi:hypothetical protein